MLRTAVTLAALATLAAAALGEQQQQGDVEPGADLRSGGGAPLEDNAAAVILAEAGDGGDDGTGVGGDNEVVSDGSVPTISRSSIDGAIFDPHLSCTVTSYGEQLGFDVADNSPVYRQKCAGLCPYSRRQTACRVTSTRSVTVSPVPVDLDAVGPHPNTELTWIVDECDCEPAPCWYRGKLHDHGSTIYDGCARSCTCLYGKITNCCRVRRDWNSGMDHTERRRYLDAVVTASTVEPHKTQYDALITEHRDLFFSGIHTTDQFLPWHR